MSTKIIVSVLASVLAVGAAAAAAIAVGYRNQAYEQERAEAEATVIETEIEIPLGKYYRNGDTSDECYIHVMEDNKLKIESPDLEGMITEWAVECLGADETEILQNTIDGNMNIYGGEKNYIAMNYPTLDTTVVYPFENYTKDGPDYQVGFDYPRDGVLVFLDEEYILG